MKNISILGSTGSIGTSTIKVIKTNPDMYRIVGLSAGNNIALIKQQIEEFRPVAVAVSQEELAKSLRSLLPDDIETEIYWGKEGFKRIAVLDDADMVVSAMSGAAGLIPT